jgi:hypothetical protein
MLNSHTKEVMQRTEVFHGKLILQSSNNAVELWRGGGEHDVVHIEEQVGCLRATVIYE